MLACRRTYVTKWVQEVHEKQQVAVHTVVAKVAQLPDGSTALAVMSKSCTSAAQDQALDSPFCVYGLSGTQATQDDAGGTVGSTARQPQASYSTGTLECIPDDASSHV